MKRRSIVPAHKTERGVWSWDLLVLIWTWSCSSKQYRLLLNEKVDDENYYNGIDVIDSKKAIDDSFSRDQIWHRQESVYKKKKMDMR
jgi:hypothetical protein